jgi:hypothetical protein
MDEEQLFREHNLTIADLAERLKVPEHNLRRLINTTLGHRNFNAFVNGYRSVIGFLLPWIARGHSRAWVTEAS